MAADPLLSVDPQIAALDPVAGPSSCTSPSPMSDRPRFVGAGLKNLGNTCFLNAVLQCLTHTVPFVQKILKTDHSPCFRAADGDFCSFCAFKQHLTSCLLLSGYVTSPVDLAENLSRILKFGTIVGNKSSKLMLNLEISPHFQLGQQEDAHEFLQSLLDSIHSCCLGNKSEDWKSSLDKDSFVTQVFGGCLRSQLRCCGCGHLSDTFEPLLDLSLEIDNANSVVDALTSFTRLEKIDDSEIKLTCDGCKSQVTMEKQLKLNSAPEVLALHLKRFKNDGNTCYKIYDSVNFPSELDLSSFLSCPADEVQFQYDLSSVLVHIGSPYSGHYYCFVRSSPSIWYQIDDRKVTRVSEEFVLEQEAYVLFYVKQGTSCWFSSFLESERKHIVDTRDTSPISVLDHLERYHSSPTNSEGSCSGSRESPEEQVEIPSVKPQDKMLESKMNVAENSVSDDNRPPLRSAAWSISAQDLDVLFEDEIKEDEKDDSPPAEELKATAKKGNQPVLESTKGDTQVDKAFNRLVRGMPKSRRSGIMACLTSQHGSFRKRSLNLGDSSGSKKTKVCGMHEHDDGSQQRSRTMSQSLSPRSIRRGLFIEGSNMS